MTPKAPASDGSVREILMPTRKTSGSERWSFRLVDGDMDIIAEWGVTPHGSALESYAVSNVGCLL